MIQNIKDIKTPVHVLIELEFSFFRTIVLDENQVIIGSYTKPILGSDFSTINRELKHLNIKSCQCFIWSEVFTLIPNDLSDETDSMSILQSLHSSDCSKLMVKKEKINACQGVIHYGIPAEMQLAIISLFTGTLIKNGLSILLSELLDHKQTKTQVSCHISNDSMWLALKMNDKLEFVNHFKINSIEDVLYFVSVVIKDKNLSNDTVIELKGKTNIKMIELLKSYYKGVVVAGHAQRDIPSEFSNLLTPAIHENN